MNIRSDPYRLNDNEKTINVSINEVIKNERKSRYEWKIFNWRYLEKR